MKTVNTKELSLTSIFAALYAIAVITLAPISFEIFQIRIADALLPLAIIFGWPTILGVTIGTLVANFFGGLGIIDILGGTGANFIAAYLAWVIGRWGTKGRWIIAVLIEVLTVTLIVGSYLSYLFNMPLTIGLSGVLLGSIIAIGFVGYLLIIAITRPFIISMLNSHGIKTYILKNEKM